MSGLRHLSRGASRILQHAKAASLAQRAALGQPSSVVDMMPAASLILSRRFSVSSPRGVPSHNSSLDPALARATPPTNYGLRWVASTAVMQLGLGAGVCGVGNDFGSDGHCHEYPVPSCTVSILQEGSCAAGLCQSARLL